MQKNVMFKLAASSLVLGITMVGCKPAAVRPVSASALPPEAPKDAADSYAKAMAKAQEKDFAAAVPLAERAVELSTRDVGYRMTLADLYLKNGRFASAEAAFSDILMLDPKNERAALARTLSMIGLGKTGEAQIELDRLVGSASAADVGLALALAGQADRAIEMLEPAARAPEANGRVRQNLALAYALAGNWERARIVASQDLSPAEVGTRLRQWAALANPAAPASMVASILGVTPAASDPGQPVRLALATPPSQAFAEAEVPVAAGGPANVEPVPAVPVAVAAAVPAPQVPAAAQAFNYEAPVHGDVFAAAVQSAAVEIPVTAARSEVIAAPVVTAAVASLVEAPVPAKKAPAPVAKAPILAFTPKKAELPRAKPVGRYVVQIGAYRTAGQVEQAWARAYRRYDFAGGQPLSTTISLPRKGLLHRLAVSGYDRHQDASRLCQSIRNKGGTCFVRATAGDAPVQWASRYQLRRG